MQSQRRAPRSLCAAGTADRLDAAGPFPAVCQSWCYSMTVSTSLGTCLLCLPLRAPRMTGPSSDPWKHRGFAPITAAGRWNSGLRAPSCLFTSPILPGEWEKPSEAPGTFRGGLGVGVVEGGGSGKGVEVGVGVARGVGEI